MARLRISSGALLMSNDSASTEYPVVENTTTSCPDQSEYQNIFIHGSLGLAIVIVLIFSFLERRAGKYPDCCKGRPGLVVPINLLDDFTNKWGYAFAFGAITNTIVILFTDGSSFEFEGPLILKVLVALITAVEMCVNLFPFFACIATDHKITGSVIGFMYSSLWFSMLLYFTLECLDPVPDMVPYLGLVVQMPTLMCLFGLVLWFLVMFSLTIHRKRTFKTTDNNGPMIEPVAREWQVNYVHDLFNSDIMSDNQENLTWKQKFMSVVNKYVFAKRPNFEFSTRVFCTVFVVFMCTYQLGVTYFWVHAQTLEWFSTEVYTILDLMNLPANNTFVNNVQVSTKMLTIGWQTTIAFTLLLFVIDTGAIFFRYRKHTLMLYKGDNSFMPDDLNTDPAEIMRCCMLYSGFQVAYMIWGFFILNLAMWVIVLLLCFVIILPIMNRNYKVVRYIAEVFLIPFLLNFILRITQKAMARSLFLQPKIKPDDSEKPLAINNRKLFHITNYFFFFANIATGLFSCLVRIMKGLAFGLVFLGRIDRCLLMPGAESGDKGFCSYLGMLRIEVNHNHPILRTFCQMLIDHTSAHAPRTARSSEPRANHVIDPETPKTSVEEMSLSEYHGDSEVECAPPVDRRARRRWWLLYTLIKNPTLIPDRRFDIVCPVDAVAREIDVNVIVARKRKYDRLKLELLELEKLLKTGSKADLLDMEHTGVDVLVKSIHRISFHDSSSVHSNASDLSSNSNIGSHDKRDSYNNRDNQSDTDIHSNMSSHSDRDRNSNVSSHSNRDSQSNMSSHSDRDSHNNKNNQSNMSSHSNKDSHSNRDRHSNISSHSNSDIHNNMSSYGNSSICRDGENNDNSCVVDKSDDVIVCCVGEDLNGTEILDVTRFSEQV